MILLSPPLFSHPFPLVFPPFPPCFSYFSMFLSSILPWRRKEDGECTITDSKILKRAEEWRVWKGGWDVWSKRGEQDLLQIR